LVWALGLVVAAAFADLLGLNLRGWLESVWDALTGVAVQYLVAAIVCGTVQTVATAYAWYSILHYAYPGRVAFLPVLASYAASVALNNILPANLGTLVFFFMLLTIIAGVTFAGILGGYAVEKIFYTTVGAFPYLYLFLTVNGSFDLKFSFVHSHPWAVAIILIGGVVLIALVVRRLWPRVVRWWAQAKEGGKILARPGAYFGRVFLPSAISWVAMLGVIASFLAAYHIPVSFDTLMRVVAGNSIANVTSVTPGGAGVTQAFNVASLNGVTTPANATAYSVAQQLVMTAWTIVFAITLMVWAFGWTGGKALVERSYEQAKDKAAEQRAQRQAKKTKAA
jgi:uncharacterized membrane protein YbhN (UPF0104 family)